MTVDQLNRTKLDPLSFRIYAALLCEDDMSINRLSYRTGMTRKAISKRLPSLISKQLVIKTNNRSKVATYSGLDTTESIDAIGEYNDSVVESNDPIQVESKDSVTESDDSSVESINPTVESKDPVQDIFIGGMGATAAKFS